MAGYELATAYVNLVVETGDAGKRIGGMFKGVEGTAANTGRGAGKKFAQAFDSAKPIDIKADVDKAAAQVAVASKKVKAARDTETAAARKVSIEEAKLAEQRASGSTKASTLLATEDRLARAKQAAALASEKVENAVQDEASAKTKSIAANQRLEASQKDVSRAADKTGKNFGTLKERIQAALKGNFKGAFSKVPKDADASADKVEDRFEKAGKKSSSAFGQAFKGALGGIAAYLSVDAVVGGFKSIMTETGNLEQSVGAIQSVFKESGGTMLKWSEDASTAVGLSKNEYNELGTLIGSQLKNAGTSMDDLAPSTNKLIGLGADLSSMFGGTTREAVEAVSSALKGERDPIEKYGVSLRQSAIDAKAAELGFKKTGGSLDANATSAATVALIMEQTADAQGNFSRESDTLAHKQQVAAAQWDNLKGKMGDLFLPMLTRVMGAITGKALPAFDGLIGKVKAAAQWFKAWWPVLLPTAVGLAGLGVATWVATGGLTAMGVAIKGVFLAISTGIKAIPVIGWIIAGIGLLVTALIWFFTKTEMGQKIWSNTWAALKTAAAAVFTWFQTYVVPLWNTVMSAIGTALTWVWNTILKPTFNALVAFWQTIIAPALSWLGGLFAAIFTAIGTAIKWWWNSVLKPVFSALVKFWKTVIAPVLAWLKNTFEAIFLLIGALIKHWWNNSVKPIFNAVVSFVKNTLGPIFAWFRDSIIKPVWNFIKRHIMNTWVGMKIIFTAIKNFVKDTLGPIFRWFRDSIIKPVWNGIKTAISTVWNKGIKPVFTALGNFIKDKVAPKFKQGVDAISKAWDGLKNAAKKPVKFVINKVINEGIIDRFNSIADKFPGTKNIKHVSLPKGFRSGGKVWGAGTETSDSIPARLSRNEHVLTAKDVRNLGGHGGVYALRKAAAKKGVGTPAFRNGGAVGADGIPGFAKGGTLSDAARWLQTKGARITEFKAWGQRVGRHSNGSQHYTGHAFDANAGPGGENATEKRIFDNLVPQLLSKFPGLKVLWRVPGHHNHLHVGTGKGGKVGTGGPGGGAGILDSILAPFRKFKDGLGKKFEKYGKFGEVAKGMAVKAVNAPINWIKSKADLFGDFVSEKWQGAKNAAAEAQVKGAALPYGWATGSQWSALHTLIGKESGWNQNAANPSSSARGLFQKMTSIHGPIEKTAFGQAKWGLKYIKNTYGTPVKALAKWMSRSPHWYAKGGAVDPTGSTPQVFDGGGLLKRGTQLVQHNSSKPDRVLSEAQWDGIYEAAQGRGTDGMTIQLTTPVVEKNEVNEWLDSVGFAFNHLGKTRAFSGVNG